MSRQDENVTASTKVTSFISKNKILFIGALICFCVAIVGFIVVSKITEASKDKSLSRIEEISFTLTDGSSALSEGELEARQLDALDSLASLNSKGGIVGARANMLSAEISFQMKKYEDAASYWTNVAKKSRSNYLYPLAMYNLGVAYEQLGKTSEASESYKAAYENKNCLFACHAGFSYGRTLEALGKYAEAVEIYQKINDAEPGEAWSMLAKTRIIALKAEKKVE